MRKSELATRLLGNLTEKHPSLTETIAKEAVDGLIHYIVNVVRVGGRMEIRGFGAFELKHYPERIARNPKNNTYNKMSARYRLKFKMGKKLKLRLNASYR